MSRPLRDGDGDHRGHQHGNDSDSEQTCHTAHRARPLVRRIGASSNITSTLNIISGVPAVSETPVTGTCNDNNFYQANFRSHHAGWRASVWIEKNGWIGFFGPYGTNLEHYSYTDNNTPVPDPPSCISASTTELPGTAGGATTTRPPVASPTTSPA